MNDTPMIECPVCGRNHADRPATDCRSFRECPKCGDCYDYPRGEWTRHVFACDGQPSMNVTPEAEVSA